MSQTGTGRQQQGADGKEQVPSSSSLQPVSSGLYWQSLTSASGKGGSVVGLQRPCPSTGQKIKDGSWMTVRQWLNNWHISPMTSCFSMLWANWEITEGAKQMEIRISVLNWYCRMWCGSMATMGLWIANPRIRITPATGSDKLQPPFCWASSLVNPSYWRSRTEWVLCKVTWPPMKKEGKRGWVMSAQPCSQTHQPGNLLHLPGQV